MFHDEINAQGGVNLVVSVDDRQRHLPIDRNFARFQFVRETLFVDRFKQAWPQGSVHEKAGVDNDTRQMLNSLRKGLLHGYNRSI